MNSYNAEVLDGNPDLDVVHVYTKLKHRGRGENRLGIVAQRLHLLARLRAERFEYVISPRRPSTGTGSRSRSRMPALTAANRRIALHISAR